MKIRMIVSLIPDFLGFGKHNVPIITIFFSFLPSSFFLTSFLLFFVVVVVVVVVFFFVFLFYLIFHWLSSSALDHVNCIKNKVCNRFYSFLFSFLSFFFTMTLVFVIVALRVGNGHMSPRIQPQELAAYLLQVSPTCYIL